jgi:hypothetical protein
MSVIGSNILAGASGQAVGYNVERSLRFNSSDSAYLSRTPSSSGNRRTWTFSFWCKRTAFPAGITWALGSFPTASIELVIGFTTSQQFYIEDFSGSVLFNVTSAAVFRDPSAWYHFLVSVDTTQATAANRVKLYVNGSEITAFATATYPTQNHDVNIWDTSQATAIGARGRTFANPANFYLADIHFIDGQALTPSSFTEVSATTGQLIPKKYTGTFGTNGFWLQFADNSSNTATTLGKDTSGNGNNWTPTNFSVTAGAGNDSLVDTPTSYGTDTGAGGEVRGNYCTLNPLGGRATVTLANGNLERTGGGLNKMGTFGMSSGKWYWEIVCNTLTGGAYNGITEYSNEPDAYDLNYMYSATGAKFIGTATSAYGASYAVGDVVGFAYDADAGSLTCYKNGVSQGVLVSGLAGKTLFPVTRTDTSAQMVCNFGQRPFAYTAPSGFKALCDTNLPAPVVAKPNTAFDVLTWIGTDSGTTRSFTGLNFSPDLVWSKVRSTNYNNVLWDKVRDVGINKELISNATSSEGTGANTGTYGYLSTLDSNGFTFTRGSAGSGANPDGYAYYDELNATYVAWCWDAGTTTSSNVAGSITTTVSVRSNTTAGFSVVTYTGTGTNCTVGHGLGVAPSLIIVKSRSAANDWAVYHAANTSDPKTDYLLLNSTAATADDNTYWNDTAPTSTVFSIGTNADVNTNGTTYVAYCWAPLVGYSNGFSYTGNGSTDGSFVYLGFRPRLILLKCSSTTGNWTLVDTAREGYNVDNDPLYPNLSDAEGTTDLLDITSNGFKLRTTDASVNSNAATYIGFAWAESPFNYSRAR